MFGNKLSKVEKAIEKKNAKVLISLINDSDVNVASKAILGLGKVGGDDSFNAITSFLHSPNKEIRIATATAMAEMNDSRGHEFVSHQMALEKDPQVQEAFKKALSTLRDEL